MGLTIHWDLALNTNSITKARKAVSELRSSSLDLPFTEVSEVVEFIGDDCKFDAKNRDEYGWLKIQAAQYVREGNYSCQVTPKHIIAFMTYPGDGCEQANFGLCLYPKTIKHNGKALRTKLSGWTWNSFCKTQYASNPENGGIDNFLHCHLLVIALLDQAKKLGILSDCDDEGEYFQNRSIKALVTEIGEWNEMIQAIGDKLKQNFSV